MPGVCGEGAEGRYTCCTAFWLHLQGCLAPTHCSKPCISYVCTSHQGPHVMLCCSMRRSRTSSAVGTMDVVSGLVWVCQWLRDVNCYETIKACSKAQLRWTASVNSESRGAYIRHFDQQSCGASVACLQVLSRRRCRCPPKRRALSTAGGAQLSRRMSGCDESMSGQQLPNPAILTLHSAMPCLNPGSVTSANAATSTTMSCRCCPSHSRWTGCASSM